MTRSAIRPLLLSATALAAVGLTGAAALAQDAHFERVATYPVFLNLPEDVDPAAETVAEIVAATADGMTLAYTDGAQETIGFVDITDPATPQGLGHVAVDGEPTSVAIAHGHAYAGVNTAESYTDPSGHLSIIDIAGQAVAATCALPGQPDSVAVSPDGSFVAIAIENERDEELNEGEIPQLPAGSLAVFSLGADGLPTNCDEVTVVDLTGLAETAPSDPEPEFVDINTANHAAVSLQENNHIVIVDLASASVASHFSAGTVDLSGIDTVEDEIVAGTGSLEAVAREPDALSWIGTDRLITANEGDYVGGSRGFTIFAADGSVLYDSAERMEHLAMARGHYPEGRAENKGVEPEGVTVGTFGEETLLFVNSERGNFVTVWRDGQGEPALLDFLPTPVAPEGLLALPERGLFVVATEEDVEEEGIRATLSLYARGAEEPFYPDVVSQTDEATGAPIGWGALSGMFGDADEAGTIYAVNDSFYAASRIYTLDVAAEPAVITDYVDLILDGELMGYDLEGVAGRSGGGFWAVSEGRLDRDRHNLLLQVAEDGTVEAEIMLPEEVEAQSVRFGFEGVATWGDRVIVAIQREWNDDPENHVKLAVYDPAAQSWSFVRYPIDAPSSPRGGWVGLSEITAIGDDEFLLIERDNQPGVYSTHKVLTHISLADVEPAPFGGDIPVVEKTVVADLLAAMRETNGWVGDKPEGIAVTAQGRVLVVTDNDGVDDASGETQLIDLGPLSELLD
jgi:DNA-binding beta-propeller fold protein YncE